jgi:hypothetical protein
MIVKFIVGAVCAGILFVAAPAVQAATVFNLGGSNATQSSFNYTVDGIGLTVTGERKDKIIGCGFLCLTSVYQGRDVTRTADGLGVVGPLDTSAELDGQINERMTFSFDKNVSLMSIMFNNIDGNDPYDIYVDTGTGFTLITAAAMANPYVFSPFLVGNTLRIGVTDNASAFRVKSLTVAAVPIPAAGFLLLAGLGGLGALRRRQTKKQS